MHCILCLAFIALVPLTTFAQERLATTTIRADNGTVGGHVPMQAGIGPNGTNYLKKQWLIRAHHDVDTADIQIKGALRSADGHFTWDKWKWLWFSLNGHQWVRRVQDVDLHRTRGKINWQNVTWSTVKVPNVRFLREGKNELTIWTTNPPEYGPAGRKKFFVVAFDNSGRSQSSYSQVAGKWSNKDLNGDRSGAPQGEWMIRLRLHRQATKQRARLLVKKRLATARKTKVDFLWGFTDALHRVFPDRIYSGKLHNRWTIDAARNEYESCQLVVIPAAVKVKMAEVFVSDFVTTGKNKTSPKNRISGKQVTVRLVRTARSRGVEWPDPLPNAYPIDVERGALQSWWLTIHVPPNAQPGLYESTVTITSMSTGGNTGKVTRLPLRLRVRKFAVPTQSPYETVGPSSPQMAQWKITQVSAYRGSVTPKVMLDKNNNLKLDFSEFDAKVAAAMARGQRTFSLGLSYTGANQFAAYMFDWRVPVEGSKGPPRRIYVNPVFPDDLEAKRPESKQSRKWFAQYLSGIHSHLETKGWTKYWWIYAADEPHDPKWRRPLKRYFDLIREHAPNLRIMITKYPTAEYGPNLDIACVMINHLRHDSLQRAIKLKQQLWCYSCGHLNNPALTLNDSPVDIRTWFWLQEKWGVQRVLLWQTLVYSRNFDQAGADRRGDGQVFYRRVQANGKETIMPSIRAEMLRDGVEDRDYIRLLKTMLPKNRKTKWLRQTAALSKVPASLVRSQYNMSGDIQQLLDRRKRIADSIEALMTWTK